jgi:hypothetical protein
MYIQDENLMNLLKKKTCIHINILYSLTYNPLNQFLNLYLLITQIILFSKFLKNL